MPAETARRPRGRRAGAGEGGRHGIGGTLHHTQQGSAQVLIDGVVCVCVCVSVQDATRIAGSDLLLLE